MQALILVGGEGTRLRPLTETVPKSVMPLAGRPFLSYMIDWLGRHGVEEVVLACGFGPTRCARCSARAARPRLRYVEEPEPRGTAGAIKFAAEQLDRPLPGPQRRRPHRPRPDRADGLPRAAAGARDPRPLPGRRRDRIRARAQSATTARCSSSSRSPTEPGPGEINAGTYVLEHSVLDLVPDGRDGLDRARRLPAADRRRVCTALPLRGLLDGHRDTGPLPAGDLGHPRAPGRRPRSASGSTTTAGWSPPTPSSARRRRVEGPALVEDGARIGAGAVVGPAGGDRARLRDRGRRGGRLVGAARGLPGRRGRQGRRGDRSAPGSRSRPGRDGRARQRDRGGREGERMSALERLRELDCRAPARRRAGAPRTTCATRSGGSSRRGCSRREAAGVMVCGMGGSAIGGDLAAAALGERSTHARC